MGRERPWRFILLALIAIGLPGVGVALGVFFLPGQVEGWKEYGWLTGSVFVVAAGLLVGWALVPTHLTSLLAGYLYGVAGGIAVASAAVALGTVIGYRTARRMTREELRHLLGRSRWGKTLIREFLDRSERRTGLAVGLARLAPQMPFAFGTVLAAAAGMRLAPLLFGTLVGMLPRMTAVIWVGAELSTWRPGAPLPTGLAVATGCGFVGLLLLGLWSAALLRGGKPDRASPEESVD